ncbi:MAG: NAD+ synthase [Candidatus Bathyarchaeia archaeon]
MLRLAPHVLELDWADVESRIKHFIKNYVEKAEADGIVLGLSGGIDSSTVAALSALAIGGNKVLGLIMPEKETYNQEDIEDAKNVAEKYGIKTKIIDITAIIETIQKTIPEFDPNEKISKGNIKARTRMICLYYYANKHNLIVCGSSDKSEAMMGYFTKWGDVAADIAPIMDLYKTQVRKLAQYVGLPQRVINKPATPALWPGQKAEDELGLKYETLDLILYGLEHFMEIDEIANQLGIDKAVVQKVSSRLERMEHKRRMPITIKLQYRTIGMDFKLPQSI